MESDITARRLSLAGLPLRKASVAPDPVAQFDIWLKQAADADLFQHNAMGLAAATPQGRPSLRMVMLEAYDEQGFVFYTSYDSRKASELDGNPWAALVFDWGPLYRQVRIEGEASRLSQAECVDYFARRPLAHQLQFHASVQGAPVDDQSVLRQRRQRAEAELEQANVPFPESFGGYRVHPVMIDFWQGRQDWLHDWLRYRRQADGGWLLERLSP